MKTFLSLIILLAGLNNLLAQQWNQLGSDIDGEAGGDESGWSSAISKDSRRVAIGAYLNDAGSADKGSVRVFEFINGIWTQVGNDIDGEALEDRSGYSVSISTDGSRVAIGAIKNDGSFTNAGHVRVYEDSNGSWVQIGGDIDGEAAYDEFGFSVSLSSSGSRVAVGARTNDGNGTSAGHVRIFEDSAGSWVQLGADLDGEAGVDFFGTSVSLSSDGSLVAIGGNQNDGSASNAGHTRIYEYNAGNWIQLGSDIDGEAAGDNSGWNVCMADSGKRVAIGAIHNDGNGSSAGHVRVFDYIGSTWTQVGSDIDGEAAMDRSGGAISFANNGNRIAIGARENDGLGAEAGHVRVYDYIGGNWVQLGNDINGEAIDDYSSWSTSISSDGTRLAIGAPYNSGNGNWSGHVRVYTLCDTSVSSTIDTTICYGETFEGYNVTGSFIDVLVASNNCDSIRTINLTILPINTFTINTTICFGESFEGYNATGNYIDTLIVFYGCDSIRTINLIVLPINIFTIDTSICYGDSFLGYNASDTYTDNFIAANGCDSVRTINLIVLPNNSLTINSAICFGDTFLGYNTSGTYIDNFTAFNGCDSIRVLTLIVSDTIKNTINFSICEGESIDGYTASGVYTDIYTAFSGCDSIRELTLTVEPNIDTTFMVNQADSIYAGGAWQTQSGLYYDTLETASGCDSVVITNFVVGINETVKPKFSIYPNPTKGKITITSKHNANIALYDLTGREVLRGNVPSGKSDFNLSGLNSGIYIYKLWVGDELKQTDKIVKVE